MPATTMPSTAPAILLAADTLYVTNEGKILAILGAKLADEMLNDGYA
jgi:hypothetical protein